MSPWGSAEIAHVIIANSSLGTLVTSQVDYVQVSLALKYTLWEEVVTTPFEAIKSIWIEFSCFQWAKIDMKCTCGCSPTKSDLTLTGLSLQCQVGPSKSKNRSLGGHFPKYAFALWQIRINNCIFFLSFLTNCSNNAPSNHYSY